MSIKTPEEWGEMYVDQIDKYNKFKDRLILLIKDLIGEYDIESPQITGRTKDKDSFVEKIKRKSYKYPFEQCTDLVGIRIIVLYLDDLDKISEIIENEFLIDYENSADKSKLYDPDRFGYLSIHYVASLSESRSKQPEWKPYSELKFEIQIRTILQHAWSEIDHKLRYKKEDEVPKELKRNLYRLIALLELADKEFKDILDSTRNIKRAYTKEIEDMSLRRGRSTDEAFEEIGDIELNIISINTYLNITKVDIYWMEISNKILSDLISMCIPKTTISLVVSAYVEKEYEKSQSILCAANITGIKNIYELDAVIQNASSFGERLLKGIYTNYLEDELKGFHFGTSVRWFNSYDNLAVLILYAKKDVFREHPDRLDKIKCIDYALISGLKLIIDKEFSTTK